jgi:hypothetical protein
MDRTLKVGKVLLKLTWSLFRIFLLFVLNVGLSTPKSRQPKHSPFLVDELLAKGEISLQEYSDVMNHHNH